MKIYLLFIAFFVPHTLCIIGGQDVEKDYSETHFVVSLRESAGSKHFCGGALIAFNFVITAASCVKDRNVEDFYGYVGGRNQQGKQEGVMVYFDKKFMKEPTGQKRVRNNIALLHLKDNIISTKLNKVRIIDFSSNNEIPADREMCKAYGWGKTTRSTNDPTNTLQEVNTQITDYKTCNNHNSDVNESNICTLSTSASLCDFDEGGPLASTNVLWGIATEDYACSSYPIIGDVFTRVDAHKDWIEKVIDENSSTRHKPQTMIMSAGIVAVLMVRQFI